MSQTTSRSLTAAYRDQFPTSAKLFERGKRVFPNGVTHDGRFLQPFPVYIESAAGSKKYDADNNEIIDYWMGHGSLLLGHSHPAVVEAVQAQAARATHPGACHEQEIEWAEAVQRLIPSVERMRFVNSGTEATLMALRLCRIISGKRKVLKFAGHFHGWHDLLIPAADPPYDTGDFSMPGITGGVLDDLVVVPPNDLAALERAIDEQDPACVIVEGTGGHWGLVPMRGEFLRGLREITTRKKVILIFDEVITGFRVAPGGSQGHYGICPDMTTMAKILAGGLPGGCLGGRADLMAALEFDNPYGKKMKHPGTYNGNPLSAAAGVAALGVVATGEPCRVANEMGRKLRTDLNELFERKNVNWIAYGEFSGATIVPNYEGPRPDSDAFIPYNNSLVKLDSKIDSKLTHAFRVALLMGGVDFFGWRAMLSGAHAAADIDQTVVAVGDAIDLLQDEGLIR
ncbi:MAG: aminotransferase class III-fold pyridoxal phosphate-dependent enzyme [Planctomycetaceae bacterium]|nr:aminotransferase class III-fold pyridoxal phosphate-dependent enzyme [Planctomycetaceae bacterium]